jgi:hypothetical protein
VHHYKELVEKIEMDILFVIFRAWNKKILNPQQNLRGKTLEDSRRLITEVGPETLPGGAERPYPYAGRHVGLGC